MKKLGIMGCLIAGSFLINTASAQTGPSEETVNSDLRDLLQAASEDGWIEFIPNGQSVKIPSHSAQNNTPAKARDCSVLDGINPNGLFNENPIGDRKLNNVLPKLLEGLPVAEDQLDWFSGLATCGPEFATWEHLAFSQGEGKSVAADTAIAALYSQSLHIRERAGLTLAIAAGLAGDKASLRRFADMLEDSELHGTKATERDPRHILLDALLLEGRDQIGARERYEWLSENDGPEQIVALDRLTVLGGSKVVADSLNRLGQDLSLTDPSRLADLKIQAALEVGRLSEISTLLKSGSIDLTDVSHDIQIALVNRTRTALSGEDSFETIVALDLYSEFPTLYVDQDLEAATELALKAIIGGDTEKSKILEKVPATDLENASLPALTKVNSEGVSQFISEISEDLMDAERVLSNG